MIGFLLYVCSDNFANFNGGAPSPEVEMKFVSLSVPNLDKAEEDAVLAVLRSGWLTQGPKVEQFEAMFSDFIGRESLAVNSCTAALHLAHIVCGARQGSEVIVPSLTFVATPNTVRYTGADVVFADIKSIDDWTIDPQDIENKLTENTVGVTPMHFAGYPADMLEIKSICTTHNLYLVEDACHGLGTELDGKHLWAHGDVGCFSFYGNKIMTTGEGGMMVFANSDLMEKAKSLRSHGMTNVAWDRALGAMSYDVTCLGFNYRMDDLRAAIGIAQLSKLKHFISERQKVVEVYRRELSLVDEIHIPAFSKKLNMANYIFPVLLRSGNRDAFREAMQARGVQTSVHYRPCHEFNSFGRQQADLPITNLVANKCFSLPLYADMALEDVDYVCQTVMDCARLS